MMNNLNGLIGNEYKKILAPIIKQYILSNLDKILDDLTFKDSSQDMINAYYNSDKDSHYYKELILDHINKLNSF